MTESSATTDYARYSRVAKWLHWAIAFFLIGNIVVGLAMEPFKGPVRYYIMTVHQSAGMTVLALTMLRVIWRLMNPPPPYPEGMAAWEKHTAAFTHFLLYAAMVLVPLTGWMMISANPPKGTPGEKAMMEMVSKKFGMRGFESKPGSPPPPVAGTPPPGAGVPPPGSGAPPKRPKPKPISIWFVIPFDKIGVLQQLGESEDGWKSQNVLHEYLENAHKTGAFLTIALILLHLLGALKHQYIDRKPSFGRMWRVPRP